MTEILEQLQHGNLKESTRKVYHGVWTKFNKFIIRLDYIPESWEFRTYLFCAYLIWEEELKSSTVKSYISAIKDVLKKDGYPWNDRTFVLNAITKTCKAKNDIVKNRLPINKNLLETVIFEAKRTFSEQYYLEIMYSTAFLISYYGLFRIGEITDSQHAIKAINVHKGNNKNKILIFLYSSKTHGRESRPQEVKIIGGDYLQVKDDTDKSMFLFKEKRLFCPVQYLYQYLEIRPKLKNNNENLFVFSDRTPLKAHHFRNTLRHLLKNLKLKEKLYDTHSFRIGRATDMEKANVDIEKIKKLGRWKSDAVYNYLHN